MHSLCCPTESDSLIGRYCRFSAVTQATFASTNSEHSTSDPHHLPHSHHHNAEQHHHHEGGCQRQYPRVTLNSLRLSETARLQEIATLPRPLSLPTSPSLARIWPSRSSPTTMPTASLLVAATQSAWLQTCSTTSLTEMLATLLSTRRPLRLARRATQTRVRSRPW